MKRALILIAVLGLIPAFYGCSEDDVKDALQYDITIINGTTTNYEVWIDADVDSAGFVRDGSVADGATRVLSNRVIDVSFHIRLVLTDEDPETTFAHERTITSTGDDVTWTIIP
jgi:hypothetical protein